MDVDRYADGTRAITPVLRPQGPGWREVPGGNRYSFGFPCRAYFHDKTGLFVMSAVEVVKDGKLNKGPEYHISVSRQTMAGPTRCDSNAAKWALDQFKLDGAEEDNHVPSGVVRNFWRPVATDLIGLECECKAEEPAVREDKGDFVWRGITE